MDAEKVELPDQFNSYGDVIDLYYPVPDDFVPIYNEDTGFECSPDSLVYLTNSAIDLIALGVPQVKSLLVEIFKAMGVKGMRKALVSLWLGISGSGAWIGYLLGGVVYYLYVEGAENPALACDILGYIFLIVTSIAGAIPGAGAPPADLNESRMKLITDLNKAWYNSEKILAYDCSQF